nr:unnamed protein product [Callosobruchus chinensis]
MDSKILPRDLFHGSLSIPLLFEQENDTWDMLSDARLAYLVYLAHLAQLAHLTHLAHEAHLAHLAHWAHLAHLAHLANLAHLAHLAYLAFVAHFSHLPHFSHFPHLPDLPLCSDPYESLMYQFRNPQTTIARIIPEFCDEIDDCLQAKHLFYKFIHIYCEYCFFLEYA